MANGKVDGITAAKVRFSDAEARHEDLLRQVAEARARLSELELAADGTFNEMIASLKALAELSPDVKAQLAKMVA